MNNFNFGEVLTRAWQIIWKYKVLWVFGILASCGRGGGSGSGGAGRGGGGGTGPSGANGMDQFGQWASQHAGLVALIVIVALVLILLFALLAAIGRIGLIRGTYAAEQGAEQLVLGEMFSEGMPFVGRVFGLALLFGLIVVIVAVPIGVLGAFTGGVLYLCLLPLICILVPATWVAGIIVEQANIAMVLGDLGIGDGLRRGWEIVRANLGPALIMGLILGVIGIVVGLVLAIPILIVVVPAAIAYAAGNGQSSVPLVLMGICICLYLPIAIFLQGILVSYIQSAWTLTYLRLASKPDSGGQPRLDTNPPMEPADSNRTLLVGSPDADAKPGMDDNPSVKSQDSDKTVIGRSPDAGVQPKPDDNPPSEPEDPNKTVIGRPPHA